MKQETRFAQPGRLRFVIVLGVCCLALAGWRPLLGAEIKALVGGTLIDGNGSTTTRNSVILIEGERIKAVGEIGDSGHSRRGRGDLDRGHERSARAVGTLTSHLMINGHADYDHWDKTYPPLFRSVIMPSFGAAAPARRRGPVPATWVDRSRTASPYGMRSTKGRSPVPQCMSLGLSSRKHHTRARSCSAGASMTPRMPGRRSIDWPKQASISSSSSIKTR